MAKWTRCEICKHVAEAHADLKATPHEKPCEGDYPDQDCKCPGYVGYDADGNRVETK